MMKKIVPIILVLGLVISLITIPAASADEIGTHIDVSPQGPIHTTQNTTELNIRATLISSYYELVFPWLNLDLYNSEGLLILHQRQRISFFNSGVVFKISGETLSELPPGDYYAVISYEGPPKWPDGLGSRSKIVEIHHTAI
jgi:hypothetical protein